MWDLVFSSFSFFFFLGSEERKGTWCVLLATFPLPPTLFLLHLRVRVVIADQPLCHQLSGCIPPLGSPVEGQHVEHQGILLPHECVWYQSLLLKTPTLARWPLLWEELHLFMPVMAKDPPLSNRTFVFFM